jgi:uncharacterized protein
MTIVLDTNVLLAVLPKTSRFRPIVDALLSGQINLVVSTSILLEYQEVLTAKTNALVANNFLEFLTKSPGVVRVSTPFAWDISKADWDDNKFVDAGLMAGADFIVTYDGHFNVVREHPFPVIGVITPDELLDWLSNQASRFIS